MIRWGRPDDGRNGLRWFGVCAQPHCEKRAEIHLRQQGFETFLPLMRKTVRHARWFRLVNAPLSPRYLFVAFDLGRDRWRSVNGTFGVSRLIMEGERPKPIRSELVENLMTAADRSGVVSVGPDVKSGDRVRLATGPFSRLVGKLLDLDDDGWMRALLDVLGVPVRADGVGLVSAA